MATFHTEIRRGKSYRRRARACMHATASPAVMSASTGPGGDDAEVISSAGTLVQHGSRQMRPRFTAARGPFNIGRYLIDHARAAV
eukprot:109563-Chlamydomonas_euryale.AAC.2